MDYKGQRAAGNNRFCYLVMAWGSAFMVSVLRMGQGCKLSQLVNRYKAKPNSYLFLLPVLGLALELIKRKALAFLRNILGREVDGQLLKDVKSSSSSSSSLFQE
ncbi:hypothetical protein KFK09_028913 [Dendrobium nobile]|uniref:Uncharacterized protein n=1 Tax=Dendrobium nobile TaxID=94219 RepID=A0A8T3A4I3_DENNO|nr:hypothetical protein KFK09_028913 [Dendrobium nobile]